MAYCQHIKKVNCKHGPLVSALVTPANWKCSDCGSNECIWICLYCGHLACGKYTNEHSAEHYKKTEHPVMLAIDERFAFCYDCKDYVINDSAHGDTDTVRVMISSVALERSSRSGRLLRSQSRYAVREHSSGEPASLLSSSQSNKFLDAQSVKQAIVIRYRRLTLLSRAFTAWREIAKVHQKPKKLGPNIAPTRQEQQQPKVKQPTPARGKQDKPTKRVNADVRLILDAEAKYPPGVTGLRNLGNTCYMNSVLQVLGSLDDFRNFFLNNPNYTLSSNDDDISDTVTDNAGNELSEQKSKPAKKGTTKPALTSQQSSTSSTASGRRASKRKTDPAEAVTVSMDAVAKHPRLSSRGGLNGGFNSFGLGPATRGQASRNSNKTDEETSVSANADCLRDEMYTLLKVMWSGRLSLVIPCGLLQAIWNTIPSFKGYQQQDAQEFLCEMLDKLEGELLDKEVRGTVSSLSHQSVCNDACTDEIIAKQQRKTIANAICQGEGPLLDASTENGFRIRSCMNSLVNQLFNGETVSTVLCLACGNRSETVESFSDLSLEFPQRYQGRKLTDANLAKEHCHLTELLTAFTETENLGQVYICSNCNSIPKNAKVALDKVDSTSKERELAYTFAEKKILIKKLPDILRLHLKRFRWSGSTRREKIGVHVKFDESLDMSQYFSSLSQDSETDCLYRLCSVIMHHGRGFNSGHYTSYCWNSKGGFWIHYNDANLDLCSLEDVLTSQAYILFYRRVTSSNEKNISEIFGPPLALVQPDRPLKLTPSGSRKRNATSQPVVTPQPCSTRPQRNTRKVTNQQTPAKEWKVTPAAAGKNLRSVVEQYSPELGPGTKAVLPRRCRGKANSLENKSSIKSVPIEEREIVESRKPSVNPEAPPSVVLSAVATPHSLAKAEDLSGDTSAKPANRHSSGSRPFVRSIGETVKRRMYTDHDYEGGSYF